MKQVKIMLAVAVMTLMGTGAANAQSVNDLLKGLGKAATQGASTTQGSSNTGTSSTSSVGDLLGGLLEGVFSSSNLTVADLARTWTASGPAVCFSGDNFLKNAGGVAAATAVENKLKPYYTKFGLTGAKLTIDQQGNFTLAVKSMTLKGTVTQATGADPGIFTFKFTAMGTVKLGSVKTYIKKTSTSMDVMFDATKMISIISAVSKAVNNQTLSTVSTLLNQYDGLCVGFNFKGTSTGTSTNSGTDAIKSLLPF